MIGALVDLCLIFLLLSPRALAISQAPQAVAPSRAATLTRFAVYAARAGGMVSITAIHVESGERLSFNGDSTVFMSSIVKLPIAVQLFERIDRGELSLRDSVRLRAQDMRIGTSTGLVKDFPSGGVTLSIASLIQRALSESDNTASDALLRYSGGPERVTRELRRLRIRGVTVDRSYADNAWKYAGVNDPPPSDSWTPALFESVMLAVPPTRRRVAETVFLEQRHDRATSSAIAELLARIARGDILSHDARGRLLAWMTESTNPKDRILAGVPYGALVAHKSGTWRGGRVSIATNDVGIITLPGSSGTIALAVLIRGSRASGATQDSVIANVTRTVLQYWTASGGASSKTRKVKSSELRQLRWIEGDWVGSGTEEKAFNERYTFLNDSTLAVITDGEAQPTSRDTTLFGLRNANFGNLTGPVRWVATRLTPSLISFDPDSGRANSFSWQYVAHDEWLAVLTWPARERRPSRTRYYHMIRK